MIDGVRIKKLTTHSDDRGYFRELFRGDEKIFEAVGQTSATKTYPGVIKAFHWHKYQDDFWYCASGMIRAVLHDLRDGSPTKGETNQYIMGDDAPLGLVIPRGVAHGYQVLGTTSALVLYHATKEYDPKQPDEERIAFDDPAIGFDWAVQNR